MENKNINATENLKDLLSDSFAVDNSMKNRVKKEAMHAFREEFNPAANNAGLFGTIKKIITGGTVIAFAAAVAFVNPFYSAKASYSVEDSSDATTVKILRGETNEPITDKNIKIGDTIEVSGRGQTYIQAEKAAFSAIAPANIKIHSQDTVYVSGGALHDVQTNGFFVLKSKQGRVEAHNAIFSLEVTQGGETRVQVKEGMVKVFNANGEQIEIAQGNEIELRADTLFTQSEEKEIQMTTNDLKGIEKKLDIVRTRTLSALMAFNEGKEEEGQRNLFAAKNSFINLHEFFSYDELVKPLEGSVTIDDVQKKIESNTSNAYLVDQSQAIVKLIKLSEKFNKILQVETLEEFKGYNRYLILEELFKLDRNEENEFYKKRLQSHYVELYISEIEAQKTYIGKEAYLKETLQKLPENTTAENFRNEVYERLSKDLQNALENMYKLEE